MARPNKQGVDYFPLDVHLDDKFKFIEIKYGLEGFALLIKLLQKIYAYGYWYRWTEDEALLFADETRSTLETVQNVVNEALERDIFDKQLYQSHNILTSRGIQKRYKEIVRRRKDVEVVEEYLLIDGNFGVNDVINPTSSKQDDVKSTQSKVKESKVKEIKEIYEHYLSKNIIRHQKLTSPMKTAIRARLKDYTVDQIKKAIDNYATVLKSDKYWFTHKYPLADLMRDKDLRKFLDEADPFNNYAKNEYKFKQQVEPKRNIRVVEMEDWQERMARMIEGEG